MIRTALTLSMFIISTMLLSSAAFAYPSLKDETMPVAPYNWTGFYAGFNGGLVNHTLDMTDTQATTFLATIQQVSNLKFTGGFQVGYRRQLDLTRVSGVYGVELSAHFSNAEFEENYGSPFALYQLNSENQLQTICLFEFIGGIAADRVLLFLSAGLSWTSIAGSTTNLDSIVFFNSFSVDKKEWGTTLGAGMEYAFTKAFSVRLKVDVVTPNTYSTIDNTGDEFLISNNIVQGTVGINYKFA